MAVCILPLPRWRVRLRVATLQILASSSESFEIHNLLDEAVIGTTMTGYNYSCIVLDFARCHTDWSSKLQIKAGLRLIDVFFAFGADQYFRSHTAEATQSSHSISRFSSIYVSLKLIASCAMAPTTSLTALTFDCLSGIRYNALRHSSWQPRVTVKKMSQITTRSQAREHDEKELREKELHEKELDARAAHGETVVQGGTGGLSLAAQERLAAGRKAGGETRKKQITHEGYAELGKKGDHHTRSSPVHDSEVAK